jgi:hypothetical protein
MTEKDRSKHTHASTYENTILMIRAPPSQPNYLPKIPIPNTIATSVRFPHKSGGEWHRHAVYNSSEVIKETLL